MSAICSSQNVQMVLSFMACVFQHLGCQRNNCILHLCMKFNHTVNIWTEYLVLYIATKEKSPMVLHWGSEGGQQIGPSRQIHLLGKVLFRDFLTVKPQYGEALFC